nr:uncharacterized protein LOC112001534 [Quercus suber]
MGLSRYTSEFLPERRGGGGGSGGGGGGGPRRGRRFGGRITKQRLSRWVFALALIFIVYLVVSCVRMFFFGNVEDKRVLISQGAEEDGVLGTNSERPRPKSKRRKKCKNCWLCIVFVGVIRFYEFNFVCSIVELKMKL